MIECKQDEDLIALVTKSNTLLERLGMDLKDLRQAMYGNGSPGVLSRISAIESRLAAIDANRKEDHAALFKHANRNTERIVSLETSKNNWVQLISWFIGGAGIVSGVVGFFSRIQTGG